MSEKEEKNSQNEKKIIEINRLENLLFEKPLEKSKFIEILKQSQSNNNEKLNDHANFHHKFSDYNISCSDFASLYFIKHHQLNNDNLFNNFIPVITNIIKKDDNSIEITRIHLYKDFYNKKPYSTEKIKISRESIKDKKSKEYVFLSFYEDKLKKEIIQMSEDSLMTKLVKFKTYRNLNELLFLQNIYFYKNILEIYSFHLLTNKIPPKKFLSLNNLSYNEFIKNLF